MSKLEKIFLCVIIILVIAVGVMIYLYFDMRGIAKRNLDYYVNIVKQMYSLTTEENSKSVIDHIKSIENAEERKTLINVYLDNGDITQDVANDLY